MYLNSLMSTVLLMIEGGYLGGWGGGGCSWAVGELIIVFLYGVVLGFEGWFCFGSNLSEGNGPDWERYFNILLTVPFEYSMFILFDIIRDWNVHCHAMWERSSPSRSEWKHLSLQNCTLEEKKSAVSQTVVKSPHIFLLLLIHHYVTRQAFGQPSPSSTKKIPCHNRH